MPIFSGSRATKTPGARGDAAQGGASRHTGDRDPEARTDHRPWPIPEEPWILRQEWTDLLFAHWPLPPEVIRPHVPEALELDTFDGEAWIAVVPFHLSLLKWRLVPPLPGISSFPELNVRTYVTDGRRPGVYFFSLDAPSLVAVTGARAFFGLPYFHAEMQIRREGGWIQYRSRRLQEPSPLFSARYRPAGGEPREPEPGTLEHWLVERYCLHTVRGGSKRRRVEIHHPPWLLRPGELITSANGMVEALGIDLPDRVPLLHFAEPQMVLTWRPMSS